MLKIIICLLFTSVCFAAPIGGFLNMQGMNGDVDTGSVPEDLWAVAISADNTAVKGGFDLSFVK